MKRADDNLVSKCFLGGFQTCHGMTMAVVSLHTQCLGQYGDSGKIWEVFGDCLGGVLSTCSGPRYVFDPAVHTNIVEEQNKGLEYPVCRSSTVQGQTCQASCAPGYRLSKLCPANGNGDCAQYTNFECQWKDAAML